MTRLRILTAIAAAALVSACGGSDGGDDDSDSSPPSSRTISGSAATGLPLIGTVTVKDAKGATKVVTIGENGSYLVDLSGMTAPFLLRANGKVGDQVHVLHSVAVEADLDGTVNITPLTDLIVANVAGKLPSDFFKDGAFNALTPTAVKSESEKLKSRLYPLLNSLGVGETIDLLHTPFEPLKDAIDKALDIIRVEIDPATGMATIRSIASQHSITDDISKKAEDESDDDSLPALEVNSDTVAGDITAIRGLFADWSALYAHGSPTSSQLEDLTTPGFMFSDMSRPTFTYLFTQYPDQVGGTFVDVMVDRLNYSNPEKVTALVSFVSRNKNGVGLSRQHGWIMAKGSDGKWRIHGNQRVLHVQSRAYAVKRDDGQGPTCTSTGLKFSIEDDDLSNSQSIAFVVIKGPGLPSDGIRYDRSSEAGREWMLHGQADSVYRLAGNCGGAGPLTDEQIAKIPAMASYEVKPYNSAGENVKFGTESNYREVIAGRPPTMAELAVAEAADPFPAFSSDTVAGFKSYTGGDFAFEATNVAQANYAFASFTYTGANGTVLGDERVFIPLDGTVSGEIALSGIDSTVASAKFTLESNDSDWRIFASQLQR